MYKIFFNIPAIFLLNASESRTCLFLTIKAHLYNGFHLYRVIKYILWRSVCLDGNEMATNDKLFSFIWKHIVKKRKPTTIHLLLLYDRDSLHTMYIGIQTIIRENWYYYATTFTRCPKRLSDSGSLVGSVPVAAAI